MPLENVDQQEVIEEPLEVVEEATEEQNQDDDATEEQPEEQLEQQPEPEQKPDTNLVKRLRQIIREKSERVRALEQSVPRQSAELPPKPTLEGAEWDEEKFANDLLAWNELKRSHEKQRQQQQEAEQGVQQEFQEKAAKYLQEKQKLGAAADDAQEMVQAYTTVQQQAVLITVAQNPALFVLQAAEKPELLEQMASIHDPVKLAAFIARTEVNMSKTQTPQKPAPERQLTRVGVVATPKNLDALRTQAQKTRDYTQYFAAKRAQEAKKA